MTTQQIRQQVYNQQELEYLQMALRSTIRRIFYGIPTYLNDLQLVEAMTFHGLANSLVRASDKIRNQFRKCFCFYKLLEFYQLHIVPYRIKCSCDIKKAKFLKACKIVLYKLHVPANNQRQKSSQNFKCGMQIGCLQILCVCKRYKTMETIFKDLMKITNTIRPLKTDNSDKCLWFSKSPCKLYEV